jgi:hypothetical protein
MTCCSGSQAPWQLLAHVRSLRFLGIPDELDVFGPLLVLTLPRHPLGLGKNREMVTSDVETYDVPCIAS